MAGHTRTVATGKARRTTSGLPRKIREHLPPEQAAATKRRKQHKGARTVAADRIARTSDPMRQLDIAREYLRSAAAKYIADADIVQVAIDALITAGDRVFANGAPLTPAARQARRATATRHRDQRQKTALLVREGTAAIRRQHADAQQKAS